MQKLTVVDPHIHLWDLSTRLYPGLETPSTGLIGDNTAIARSYLLDDLIADAGEVEILKAVHVEAFPTDPVAETRHLQAMADTRSQVKLAIVANADLSAADAEAMLAAHAAYPAVRGIRQVINLHTDPLFTYVTKDYLADPAWQKGFKLLDRFGMSFDLQLYPHQMQAAARLAADNPATQIILNHAGMFVDRTLAGWRQWRVGLRLLAEQPNVCVKISGLGMFDHDWTLESIRPYVLETLDVFGAERAMFASNFPVDKLFSSYGDLWRAFAAIVADLSGDEQAALMRGTAERVYRL
ncbi:amidohydrolase family protein [Devosia nitrariae]|uniref:Amidohydrolase-related domain-containing protein n=1 Tax=Devosia nitrariae TaxID=2071872 RepID=A0ABQ5W324_9HYPH|nr:amidohydrolase family protein [Devosia nitrariae]GLQ54277.1 hypothetical protein GCM10010862_15360 [Devosia nitrariae]